MKISKKFNDLYLLHMIHPLRLEQKIYSVAQRLTQSDKSPYNGGLWNSEPLGERWYFLLSSERIWNLYNENNGAEAVVSTKAFSLIVFVIALSEFSMKLFDEECGSMLGDEIAWLHKNAMEHVELLLGKEDADGFYAITD